MSSKVPRWFLRGSSSTEPIEDSEVLEGELRGESAGETTWEGADELATEWSVTERWTAPLCVGRAVVDAIVFVVRVKDRSIGELIVIRRDERRDKWLEWGD